MEDDISQFITEEQVKADKIVELKSWEQLFRKNEKNHPLSNSVYNIELILENDIKLRITSSRKKVKFVVTLL